MEEVKKRKADEELQNYRRKAQMKQQVEKKSLEDFRYEPADDIKSSSRFLNPIKLLYHIKYARYYTIVLYTIQYHIILIHLI